MWKLAMSVLAVATAATAQQMPADYAAVLKTLGKQGTSRTVCSKLTSREMT